MRLLEVCNAGKSFGGIVANHDISLHVEAGSIVGLIGPNGSGKTTLFNSIAGTHPLDSGTIWFGNREISKLRVPKIARLGLVRTFQQTRIYAGMTCLENMQVSTPQHGRSWQELLRRVPPPVTRKAEELLEFVGLYAKRRLLAGDLSFGQQKLLEFAMALMSEPRMLLLDEPTAGINPTLINGLVNRLRRVNEDMGITLLVIEHNMGVIMNLADRLYCLAHGQLLAEGLPEQIRSDQRVIDAYLGGH